MIKCQIYNIEFGATLRPTKPHDLPIGTLLYDGYTASGMRVHVVKEDMDAPIIWQNALVISESMLSGE